MKTFVTALLGLFVLTAAHAEPTAAPSSSETAPLQAGTAVPEVSLQTLSGEPVTLSEFNDPTILVFYRGGWCPYCNVHLKELQDSEAELQALGYQIIGVSPDTPEKLQESVAQQQLSYQLLSDSSGAAARHFGIAFDAKQEYYDLYGDRILELLKNSSGEQHYQLPVPSVFLIRDGEIRYTYSNPDYKTRLSTEELIKAAKAAKQ